MQLMEEIDMSNKFQSESGSTRVRRCHFKVASNTKELWNLFSLLYPLPLLKAQSVTDYGKAVPVLHFL